MSAYVRERLFGEVSPRKTRGKFPIKDHQALARVLSRLGRSGLFEQLNGLSLSVEQGRLYLQPELENELRQACTDLKAMRYDLLRALGHRPE